MVAAAGVGFRGVAAGLCAVVLLRTEGTVEAALAFRFVMATRFADAADSFCVRVFFRGEACVAAGSDLDLFGARAFVVLEGVATGVGRRID